MTAAPDAPLADPGAGSANGRPRRRQWWFDGGVIACCVGVDLLVWSVSAADPRAGLPFWTVAVAAPLVFLTLAWRRSRPTAVLAGQLAYATASTLLLPSYATFAGVLVALQAVAARRPPRESGSWAVVSMLPLSLQNYYEVRDEQSILVPMIGQTVFYALLVLVAWGIGHRAWLAEARVGAASAAHEVATTEALRAERLRIARELHDIVAHAVTAMVLQAAGARAVLGGDEARTAAALTTIQTTGQQAMQEMRRMLRLLRSVGLPEEADLPGSPGLADVDTLIAESRSAGLDVTGRHTGTAGAVDPSVGLAAYRVVQEALTNCMKHAGADAVVRVELTWRHDTLTVLVEDRASGGPPPDRPAAALSTGLGLLGLRERVLTVGGVLETRRLRRGFAVTAVLPAVAAPPRATDPPAAASATPVGSPGGEGA
ncbi:ATPase [Pilimelia terevasa]|uniref:histidine kinase n=1 Tax=Pilimelia terevasa TaxID=53372 RepID=A0A8J3BN05_9ACTN|nr:histidine kinase [Pilimelia terevasa]GGK26211.1 ATPase [Pilimelia terevasa]